MAGVSVANLLIYKDRHDGKSVVWLKEQMLCQQQPLVVVDKRRRVVDGCAEVASRTPAVLNAERMVAPVPLQPLVTYPEGIAVAGRNHRPRCSIATFSSRKIEPRCPAPGRPLKVVDAHINVALDVVAVLCRNIRARSCQITQRHLPKANIKVFDAGAVSAHVERIEIVNLNVLATVKPFAGPEFCVGLTLKEISCPDEGFSQPKLIIADAVVEVRIAGGVRCVGLDHHFGVEPGFVRSVFRVQPVVHKDELAVGFGFVSQPIFCACTRSLECDLLTTLAVQSVPGTKISMEFKTL